MPYITTAKTIALAIWTFVGKVMSLLSNTLSRFVIAFLPRSKGLLISWLHSISTMILESKKINYVIVSTFPTFISHEVERVTGRKARCPQVEEINCKWQIFFSPSLYKIKRKFLFFNLNLFILIGG